MAYIPDINFRSLQRSKYTLIKKVSEVPFSSFGRLSMNSELSSRSAHKRIFSEENRLLKSPAKNYTPDIYITSFNHEVKKALNFIKKSPGSQLSKRNSQIEEKYEKANIIKKLNTDEIEVKNFINALFFKEHNIFRKTVINTEKEALDLVSADKIMQEAKKIIKNGIKKKYAKSELVGSIEDFWVQYISKDKIVR